MDTYHVPADGIKLSHRSTGADAKRQETRHCFSEGREERRNNASLNLFANV